MTGKRAEPYLRPKPERRIAIGGLVTPATFTAQRRLGALPRRRDGPLSQAASATARRWGVRPAESSEWFRQGGRGGHSTGALGKLPSSQRFRLQ